METAYRLGIQAESMKKVTDLIPTIREHTDLLPDLVDAVAALSERLTQIETVLKNALPDLKTTKARGS